MLVGHGSTSNAASKAPVYQHAAEMRQRKLFAEVRDAFWKEPPFIRDAMQGITTPRIFVVPLFISEGYFTLQAIPRELGLVAPDAKLDTQNLPLKQARGTQTLFYSGPVGTHNSMTNVLLARAQAITEQFPFPTLPKPKQTTLFIAGHGTEQNENSRLTIERQVELIRAMGIYADVFPLFIEEDPRIADCYKLATTKNIVIVPFFISDGMHTVEDIPVMLGEAARIVKERLQVGQPTWRNPMEKHGKQVWYASSIGNELHIADVILQRVREAAM
ncbi:MAG: Cobalamin [Verrucomicrobiales bacterium]|nr:Cobalamin [Verrucomicrobiales bacterium]